MKTLTTKKTAVSGPAVMYWVRWITNQTSNDAASACSEATDWLGWDGWVTTAQSGAEVGS